MSTWRVSSLTSPPPCVERPLAVEMLERPRSRRHLRCGRRNLPHTCLDEARADEGIEGLGLDTVGTQDLVGRQLARADRVADRVPGHTKPGGGLRDLQESLVVVVVLG